MKEQIRECIRLEQKRTMCQSAIIAGIRDAIKAQPTTVKESSNPSTARMFTIKFSDLANWNLSPDFYDPNEQARIVTQKLLSAPSMIVMIKYIQAMVNEKKVKIGSTTYHLNPQTLKILTHYADIELPTEVDILTMIE